jgi:hypothetical protein
VRGAARNGRPYRDALQKTDTQYQPLQAPTSTFKHRFNHLYDLFKSVEIASSNR